MLRYYDKLDDKYQDILPCYYLGLGMNTVFSAIFGIPFCIWELIVGKVSIVFVFAGYCGYMALVLVFYSMLYLSICKDYGRISLYFLFGMGLTVLLSFILNKVFMYFSFKTIPEDFLVNEILDFDLD